MGVNRMALLDHASDLIGFGKREACSSEGTARDYKCPISAQALWRLVRRM